MGDGETMRAGRLLAHGDLRLIALALIAEQPRHGYEIIKLLEEKTSDWYSPSPGIVYPTLTYLEDVGYVTVQTEGSKKLYSITDEGRAHLEQNRDLVDAVLERLATIGERVARWRRTQGRDRDDGAARACRRSSMPRSTTCATPRRSGSKAMPTPSRASSKSSHAPRPTCAGADRTRP